MVTQTKATFVMQNFLENARHIPKDDTVNWTSRIPGGSTYAQLISNGNKICEKTTWIFGMIKIKKKCPHEELLEVCLSRTSKPCQLIAIVSVFYFECYVVISQIFIFVKSRKLKITLGVENELFVMFSKILCYFISWST